MAKKTLINLIAASLVLIGGANLAVAGQANVRLAPMLSCSGGGGTCVCDPGQTCMHSPYGCQCSSN